MIDLPAELLTAPRPAETSPRLTNRRLAIVHDYFTQRGGAERLAERMAALHPAARVYTSVVDPAAAPVSIEPSRLTTSRLQRLFSAGVPLKALGPLMGGAFASLDLDEHDVVVSSSTAFGHRIRPRRDAVHLCYCNTPPAFLYRGEYFATARLTGLALAPALAWMRRSDRRAAIRVDRYIANSRFTAARIRSTYGLHAEVLYPAVDTAAFAPTTECSERFLVVSRLRPHKAIDLAIAAANRYRLPLDIIGEGTDRARLESLAGPTVRFLGWLDDAEVAAAMARCIALVVPGVEDFGMVTAEVQAAGRPAIGSAIGGTAEIVDDGVTGFLVDERTPEGFGEAMRRAQSVQLDADTLVASARRFDLAAFAARLDEFIEDAKVLAEDRRRHEGGRT